MTRADYDRSTRGAYGPPLSKAVGDDRRVEVRTLRHDGSERMFSRHADRTAAEERVSQHRGVGYRRIADLDEEQ